MPPDHRAAERMASLVNLQRLRAMRDEQSLVQAGLELSRSENEREKARTAVERARSRVDELTRKPEFSLDQLQLHHAILEAHNQAASSAEALLERKKAREWQSRKAWHISRHRHDALRTNLRVAEKQLSRKRNEREESDLLVQKSHVRKGDAR